MKICLLYFALALTEPGIQLGFAQGNILFANLKGLNARITDCNQVPLSGSQFMAGLFAGPTADSLAFVAAVPFLSGTASGYFNGGPMSIPGVPGGSTAIVQVAVWKISAGATFFDALAAGGACASPVLSIITASPPMPPNVLFGLLPSYDWPGFCPYGPPVPPPRLFVEHTETNTLVCSWPFSAGLFAVQESPDLTNWNTFATLPTFEGTRNRVIIPAPAQTAFYRLVSTH